MKGLLTKVVRDYFTGLDGDSYAIGKALAAIMFFVGLPLPYLMVVFKVAFSLTEAGVYYAALGGAVMALIWGTNPAEPKAK